jgi:hypothetical protein
MVSLIVVSVTVVIVLRRSAIDSAHAGAVVALSPQSHATSGSSSSGSSMSAGSSASSAGSPGVDPAGGTVSSTAEALQVEGDASATAATDAVTALGRRQLSAADQAAGLTTLKITQTGTGKLITVKGSAPAPNGKGVVKTVRIRVEGGIHVDSAKFAAFVLATLNDPHSWGHNGAMRFARTDKASANITVTLASPNTSAALCRPLITYGHLSCGKGSLATLTLYRWVLAIPEYKSDYTGYRHYVVNHEVGHTLGHGHQYCAGKGKVAPLMMQQTKGLKGCLPNPWPFP